MNAPHGGAVIYAKDPQRLAAFYTRVAELPIVRSAKEFIELESRGFQLVVLQVPEPVARTLALATPPVRRENTPIKLVFMIPDLARARATAPLHGGALNPAEQEWSFDGTRVCDGVDPEGNVFQLRQPRAAARGVAG